MPGKRSPRWRAITDSSGTNVSSPIGTNRGSTSFGTFTRANVSTSETGSRTNTPIDSDRFEMYGNGRPGPTASGVRTGKICSANSLSVLSSSSSEQSPMSTTRMPSLGQRGPNVVLPRAANDGGRAQVCLGDPLERLARRQPVRPARVDAGLHLVVQTGHAHHEELVEVGRVDREELHALEQRRSLVLGELEHALVELQP